jgi:hypothetical protein
MFFINRIWNNEINEMYRELNQQSSVILILIATLLTLLSVGGLNDPENKDTQSILNAFRNKSFITANTTGSNNNSMPMHGSEVGIAVPNTHLPPAETTNGTGTHSHLKGSSSSSHNNSTMEDKSQKSTKKMVTISEPGLHASQVNAPKNKSKQETFINETILPMKSIHATNIFQKGIPVPVISVTRSKKRMSNFDEPTKEFENPIKQRMSYSDEPPEAVSNLAKSLVRPSYEHEILPFKDNVHLSSLTYENREATEITQNDISLNNLDDRRPNEQNFSASAEIDMDSKLDETRMTNLEMKNFQVFSRDSDSEQNSSMYEGTSSVRYSNEIHVELNAPANETRLLDGSKEFSFSITTTHPPSLHRRRRLKFRSSRRSNRKLSVYIDESIKTYRAHCSQENVCGTNLTCRDDSGSFRTNADFENDYVEKDHYEDYSSMVFRDVTEEETKNKKCVCQNGLFPEIIHGAIHCGKKAGKNISVIVI